MSSPYLNDLIRIAKTDLPQLAHDLENASTIYTVQEACKRLHNMFTYALHHIIMSDPSVAAAATAAATARTQPSLPPPPAGYAYARTQNGQIVLVPTQAQAHVSPPMAHMPGAVGQIPATDHYPSQHPAAPAMPGPNHGLPLISMAPAAAAPEGGGARVTDVIITPRGTRVTAPTGENMLFPPGVPIDATGGAGNNLGAIPIVHDYHLNQPNPVTARPQFTTPDVVLPEGGGMTADVAAALARRSPEQQPLIDAAGGARNITE